MQTRSLNKVRNSIFTFPAGISLFAFVVCPDNANAQQGPAQPDMSIESATRIQTIENLLKQLNDAYVFPATAKQIEADIRARLNFFTLSFQRFQ